MLARFKDSPVPQGEFAGGPVLLTAPVKTDHKPMNPVIVAILLVELHLPGCDSLKEKRMIIRSLKDRISKKFNVSIAELNYLDKWQRAQLGVTQIANEYGFLEQSMDVVFRLIDSEPDVEVVEHSVEYV